MNQYPGTNFHDLNLDWLLSEMKNCLAEWASTKEDWEELQTSNTNFKEFMTGKWDDFRTYVENYLANLPLTEEVSAKINAMAEDGTLLELITHDDGEGSALSDVAGNWLGTHLHSLTEPPVDDTLTIPHAAADAKATGDEISDLKSALSEDKGVESRVIDSYKKTWNLFDGSFGLSQTDPITNTSLSYAVCSGAIPVIGGEYYSIGSANNPLYGTKVNVLGVRWYDNSGTRLSKVSVYPQGGYLKWMQAPAGAVNAVIIFNSNNESVAVAPNDIANAGFKFFFAKRLVNFTNRDSNGQYAVNENEWLPSYVLRDDSIEQIITHTVIVGEVNSNFTSLRDALDNIVAYGEPSEYNRFIVQIREGTYDISSYYSATEKAVEGYVGMIVPDWVTLRGEGNREKTILQYVLSNADSHICVLNLQNTCSLENLTLYGVKTRYCVHDDKANSLGTPYKRYCRNVHFKGDTMIYGAVYGAGIKSNSEWTFEDCIFESLTESSYQNCFSVHGSKITQVGQNTVKFENCRFIGHGTTNNALILSTLKNNTRYWQNYCILHGCRANGKLILREENASQYGAGIAWWATGFATTFTDMVINNTDSEDYSDHIDVI